MQKNKNSHTIIANQKYKIFLDNYTKTKQSKFIIIIWKSQPMKYKLFLLLTILLL